MDVLLALILACARPEPVDPGLSADAVAAYVRPGTADAEAWGHAVHAAVLASGRVPDEDAVCQVLAVIEQESGYQADPAVPGLATMAEAELLAALERVGGPLGDDALGVLLDAGPEGEPTFRARLATVRTERDLDRFYRDLVAFHEGRVPGVGEVRAVLFPRLVERHNPVETAGSMQVSVAWAQEHPSSRGLPRDTVRDALYERDPGVRYGALRLFAHPGAGYDPIHRFADYNAGLYASRNAAFQDRVSDLAGVRLAPDGDLLAYTGRARPKRTQDGETVSAVLTWAAAHAPELGERRILADLRLEKDATFEGTATFRAVSEAWTAKTGKPVVAARVPDVTLDSPKLTGTWTTATFAQRVDRRYRECLKRR